MTRQPNRSLDAMIVAALDHADAASCMADEGNLPAAQAQAAAAMALAAAVTAAATLSIGDPPAEEPA